MSRINGIVRISGSDINKANRQMSETRVVSVDKNSGRITVNTHGAQKSSLQGYQMTASNQHGRKQKVQSRTFNYIYSKIVESEDDFVGMVAYSIYKREKIKYIEEYVAKNGHPIPETELDKFHKQVCNSWSITGFKQKAKEDLEVFFNILIENEIETFKDAEKTAIHEYYQHQIEEISKAIKSQDKSYWYGIGQEIAGSFAVVFVIAALVFIPTALRLGPRDAFEAITGWELREKDDNNNKPDSLQVDKKAR